MKKTKVYVFNSAHLDLFWIGAQEDCLAKGAVIIDDAVTRAKKDPSFHFIIETARFLEYYVAKYPHRLQALKEVFASEQIEMSACYTDRLENTIDGEALVRNVLYGKKVTKKILGIDAIMACHPDLPGFAEQTPQIYKKSGIRYYLSARGFRNGTRFNWFGLDGSHIIMYNFPGCYGFFDMEKVIGDIEDAKKRIKSDFIILACSAGDMGATGTFITNKGERVSLVWLLQTTQENHPEIEFEMAIPSKILDLMNPDGLYNAKGETPSRWGNHGSALNAEFYFMDKEVSATLMEAEKLSTICDISGIPVNYSVDRHPLMHTGSSGGMRRYFELDIHPKTVQEWIEFAWRLQMITEDHNFGGVDGAQTHFDRIIFKRTALDISKNIKELSIKAILEKMNVDSSSVAVFNTMNWKRSQTVSFQKQDLSEADSYVAIDVDGNASPLFYSDGRWTFFAQGVPSMGLKTFRIEKKDTDMPDIAAMTDTKDFLTVQNNFYRIKVNKSSGELELLYDKETSRNWTEKSNALVVEALEDLAFSVSEKIIDKKQLDISSNNIRSVHITEAVPLWTKIEIVSEVCDVKIKQLLILHNTKKQLDVKVSFNWPGIPDIQLKMGLCSMPDGAAISYGVPYGAQEYGKYIETANYKFSTDEISLELFNRYREAQGWFSVEQDSCGLLIASNHSACDFKSDSISTTMLRDVRNGGDIDVRFSNYGIQEYEFCFTSYQGTWDKTSAYRMGWERAYPLFAVFGEKRDGAGLGEYSFVSTGEKGVLTVLAKSGTRDDAYIARLFNSISTVEELKLSFDLPVSPTDCVNLDETPCADPLGSLGAFEIKTIRLEKMP